MAGEDITYQVEGSRGASTLLYPWGASRTRQLPSWQFPLFSIRVRDAVLLVVVKPISLVYGIVAHQYLLFCLRALRLSENHCMENHLIKAREKCVRCLSSGVIQQRRTGIQA
jgi:hypothetical protein